MPRRSSAAAGGTQEGRQIWALTQDTAASGGRSRQSIAGRPLTGVRAMVTSFSQKQKAVLRWWTRASPYRDYDAIICDGAVRSGKTLSMGLSFFVWPCWALTKALLPCVGKRWGASEEPFNPLLPTLKALGFSVHLALSKNELTLSTEAGRTVSTSLGGRR